MLNKKDLIYQVTRQGGTEPPFSGKKWGVSMAKVHTHTQVKCSES